MAANWRSNLAGPIPSHPMYEDNSAYLAARRPQPRVRQEGVVNAELHRGCMDLLFKMQAMTTGGSELDKRHRKKAPGSIASSSTSSDSNGTYAPPDYPHSRRPQTPAQRFSTSRTSQVSVRPSAPPPNESQAIASLDSDVRLIRAELESLRHRLHTKLDTTPRPTRPSLRSAADMTEDPRIPPDWVERTSRRREVEEEVTYRRPNGETFRWSNRSPERTVRFASPPPSLRAREEEIAALKTREKELEEQRLREEDELNALRAQRKELQKEEKKRKKAREEREKQEKKNFDPDQPEGYRRVPDEERRAMLDLMMQAEAEVRERLSRLPVILDTFRARQEKKMLEEALDELEGAIAIYAQRKVFIRNDD